MAVEEIWDVIVIGAGVAGLAAARTLAEAGRRVLVLEAQGRIGGRIHTVRQGGVVVELGAEFLHGRSPELSALLQEAGLDTPERSGTMLSFHGGQLTEEDWDSRNDPLAALGSYNGPDCSFLEYLDGLGLPAEDRGAALGYVEGYNAAVAVEASVLALARQQVAEAESEGDRTWRVQGGYDQLPAYLLERVEAAGGEVRLGMPVTAITWRPGLAGITAGNQRFEARQVVMTLPLGVLQAGTVQIDPAPAEALRAVEQMRMGSAFRLSLVFSHRLWPEDMSFLFTRHRPVQAWWTPLPAPEPMLTAWAGGPRAQELLRMGPDRRMDVLTTTLGEAFGLAPHLVADSVVSAGFEDWDSNPWSRGAYSWVPVGGLGAAEALSEPVESTLFFAGEHTDTTGHWGTVHAAYGSGLRAAKQVLATA